MNDIVLVYDIRQDKLNREQYAKRFPRQWRSFVAGKKRTKISEGRITKLFFALYQGEHFFEIDDGKRRRSWIRLGNESWFSAGYWARVEYADFRVLIGLRVDSIQVISKIWTGKKDG